MNSIYFEKKKAKILNLYKEKKFDDAIKHGEKLLKKKMTLRYYFYFHFHL